MMLAFKQLSLTEQKGMIEKDISLIGYADTQLQVALLKQNYNKYHLYADKDVKKACPEHPFNRYLEKNSESYNLESDTIKALIKEGPDHRDDRYLNQINVLIAEKKTSSNFLLTQDVQKEAVINNKLRALYSYLATRDKDKASEAFKELCRICCERRFYLGGDKYSVHTDSAQWLINRISADDDIGEELRELLGSETKDPHQIQTKIKNIVTNTQSYSINYKERFNDEVKISRKHEEKPTPPPQQEHLSKDRFVTLRT